VKGKILTSKRKRRINPIISFFMLRTIILLLYSISRPLLTVSFICSRFPLWLALLFLTHLVVHHPRFPSHPPNTRKQHSSLRHNPGEIRASPQSPPQIHNKVIFSSSLLSPQPERERSLSFCTVRHFFSSDFAFPHGYKSKRWSIRSLGKTRNSGN